MKGTFESDRSHVMLGSELVKLRTQSWTRDSSVSRHLISNICVERAKPEAAGAAPARHPGLGKDPNMQAAQHKRSKGWTHWTADDVSPVWAGFSYFPASYVKEVRIVCGNLGVCSGGQQRRTAFRRNLCNIRCSSNPLWYQAAIWKVSDQTLIWFHHWAAGFTPILRLLMSCWDSSSIYITVYFF